MLKFFRKIRQNLLKENKFSKYLLYAIGEIVLVVLGILIALNINNRNEFNKARANSEIYINEIASDLADDTIYLKRLLINLEIQNEKENWFLNKTTFTLNDLDSLKMILPLGTWDFYINDRTFEKIQNSQESKLTGFDDLYKNITDYYNIDRKRIERNTALEIRESSKQIPIIYEIEKSLEMNFNKNRDLSGVVIGVEFPPSNQSKGNKIKFINHMNSTELRNYIKRSYSRHLLLQLGFQVTLKKAKSLISNINLYLKENEQ